MLRILASPRPHWQQLAKETGFNFHTMHGQTYWDESAYYQFSLKQIEQDIEDPSVELNQMLLELVNKVCDDDALMRLFSIPEAQWDLIRRSWFRRDPHLYGRFDFSYNGHGPAKLLEANFDTPTSLFEAGYFQWRWLEDMVNSGKIARQADQFNALQEALIKHFRQLHRFHRSQRLFFACCKESDEDFGTVEYMRSCAMEAGLKTAFCYVEDLGLNEAEQLTDLHENPIKWLFKLYPWEFMFTDEFAPALSNLKMQWLEPAWKSIISNKAILPLLWQMYEGHPNLLPAYFAEDKHKLDLSQGVVKKPLFSREGANIEITKAGKLLASSSGGYGEEGFVYQAFHALPNFDGHYPLIGSWMVNNEAVAMSIREDSSLITQDLSRFVPHIILG
ncbi:hypothetical protein C1E23_10015 [Pseudoalteromonas phenolica]|uniref:Glutathionylspermidine synthase pre-ATP-grasp-like domain-containing protein n=1 Tax=Pseudoalteromonas phenolica TaxID=161398 RepID=A0A4Q7IPA0_9GAMM|nr:glutathionylspermidine synthase family protein [Pseudoalteromonas phenolica]RZQ53256.1 hypothetical protein C1E23_10015 [Pseudoalteromonas phenolica]